MHSNSYVSARGCSVYAGLIRRDSAPGDLLKICRSFHGVIDGCDVKILVEISHGVSEVCFAPVECACDSLIAAEMRTNLRQRQCAFALRPSW